MIFLFSKMKICKMFECSEKVSFSISYVFVLAVLETFIYFSHCLTLQERRHRNWLLFL